VIVIVSPSFAYPLFVALFDDEAIAQEIVGNCLSTVTIL
jgi:hypothetical protein